MVARVAHGLGELLDGHRRGGHVGIAEREVDHVFPGSPEFDLERVDLGECVGRQRVDPAELHDWRIPVPVSVAGAIWPAPPGAGAGGAAVKVPFASTSAPRRCR